MLPHASHVPTAPIPKPEATQNTCLASVLHGPLDLRLVRTPRRSINRASGADRL